MFHQPRNTLSWGKVLSRRFSLCVFPPSVAQVPHEMITQSRNSYVDAEVHSPTLDELGKQVDEEGGNYQMYLETLMQNLQKEAKEKFKGWVTCSSVENAELAYKKVIWGHMKEAVRKPKQNAAQLWGTLACFMVKLTPFFLERHSFLLLLLFF